LTDNDTGAIRLLPAEKRAVAVLASVFALRMLGLFMLLPVLALHAAALPGATPALIGLAVGVYGITQAGLQLPFGWLSDRVGRRPVILFGLAIFVLGSLVAAAADTVGTVIAGRALQGAGAISAVVTALLADLTRPSVRTRGMAFIGVSIGASFILSLVLGPLLTAWIGVRGVFLLAALMGLVAAGLLLGGLPMRHAPSPLPGADRGGILEVLREPELLRLYVGIMCLHLTITALFVAVPFALRDIGGLPDVAHWKVYVTVLLLSLPGTIILILVAERWRHAARVLTLAVAGLGLALAFLGTSHVAVVPIAAAMTLYFACFNFLEARMPALLSQAAPAQRRGAALGVFASAQFFGAFLGGGVGGWVMGVAGISGVFFAAAAAALVWLMVNALMARPRQPAETDKTGPSGRFSG
jgi:MFS family permease